MSKVEENDALAKKLKKRKINKKNVNNYFTEYCNNTSIHGFKYLGEHNRSCFEKLWWFITITVSLFFCIFLIMEAYRKWQRSPVLVSFATKQTPIMQIPFPAITICPETKAKVSVYNLTENFYWYKNDKMKLRASK